MRKLKNLILKVRLKLNFNKFALKNISNGVIMGSFVSSFLYGTVFFIDYLEKQYSSNYLPSNFTLIAMLGLYKFLFSSTKKADGFIQKSTNLTLFYFTGLYLGFVLWYSDPQISTHFMTIHFIGTLGYYLYLCFIEVSFFKKSALN